MYVHATQERHVDLEIYQGATFVLRLQWLDDDDNPVDLTGATASMQIRDNVDASTVLHEASTDNGEITFNESEGRATVTIPASVTSGFDWTEGVYDLLITRPDNSRVDPIVRGGVGVKKAITRS